MKYYVTEEMLRQFSNKELVELRENYMCTASDSCSYLTLEQQAEYSDKADRTRAEIMRRLESKA